MNRKRLTIGAAALAFAIVAVSVIASAAKPAGPAIVTNENVEQSKALLSRIYRPMPPDWAWASHTLPETIRGGGDLRWGVAGEQGAPTIIFVPGFLSLIEYNTDLYASWLSDGYRVVAVDLPGQGGSVRGRKDREKPWSQDMTDYADALADFVLTYRKENDGAVYVIGESFAGLALTHAATQPAFSADGVILLVPGLNIHFRGITPWVAKTMIHGLTAFGFGNSYAFGEGPWAFEWSTEFGDTPCRVGADDINVTNAIPTLNPELRMGGATNGWLSGFLKAGAALEKPGASAIGAPVALITADRDNIVNNDRALSLCENGFGDCRAYQISSGHCLAYEKQSAQEAFLSAVNDFILANEN